jgi:hypothetical protein
LEIIAGNQKSRYLCGVKQDEHDSPDSIGFVTGCHYSISMMAG